jgi:hypothetical protein
VEENKEENRRLEDEAAARERYPGAVLPSEIPKMLAESKYLPQVGHWSQGRLHLDKNAASSRPHGWHDITYNKERVFDDELEPVKSVLWKMFGALQFTVRDLIQFGRIELKYYKDGKTVQHAIWHDMRPPSLKE